MAKIVFELSLLASRQALSNSARRHIPIEFHSFVLGVASFIHWLGFFFFLLVVSDIKWSCEIHGFWLTWVGFILV